MTELSEKVSALLAKGVIIHAPASIEVGADVSPEAIASGVVIHAGSRIHGAETWIGEGCVIGEEAPATVDNCQLGAGVALKGGYFKGATFLDGSSMGSCAHIRPGTLLEEQANGAHSVGLKQTIFLPYVTAGSLINFCDALMSGGTSRKNHSEIGSSYIHFNFTPHQDKATASLVGDVPRGVMLNQAPIFLGGQGGLVGPVRIEYGSLIPAGVVFRRNALEAGQILFERALPSKGGGRAFTMGLYGSISRIVTNNLHYLGNIAALQAWYREVRSQFFPADHPLFLGAVKRLEEVMRERMKRLDDLADKVKQSADRLAEGEETESAVVTEQGRFIATWLAARERVHDGLAGPAALQDAFLSGFSHDGCYLDAVHGMEPALKEQGVAWLQSIVDAHVSLWTE